MFESEAAHEKTAAEAKAGASEASKVAEKYASKNADIRRAIQLADEDAASPNKDVQKRAYDTYVSTLRSLMKDEDFSAYKAAVEHIDRAATLEEKTKRARSLLEKVGKWAIGGAVVGLGLTAGKVVHAEELPKRGFDDAEKERKYQAWLRKKRGDPEQRADQ